ncbi:hypothetical protein JCM6882_005132 [Rhodosporidiobolus microsporus]
MADPTPSTTQALREQGNAAFRSSRWEEAVQLYSQALEATVTSGQLSEEEKEHLAALYSNRAAARIQLSHLDLALLDASAAYLLLPRWSRAHAREAEAFARLHDFEKARASYASATDLAEDDATRARYMSSSAAAGASLAEQQQKQSLFSQAETSLSFAANYDKYVKEGGDPEKEGLVSASTAVYSRAMVDEAFKVLDEKLEVNDTGDVEAVSPSPILELADAIITDARGFYLPSGKSHDFPLAQKLSLQLQYDGKVFDIDKFLQPNTVPKDVIDEFDKRATEDGWQKVKPALAHLIRGCFVAAYINEVQLRSAEAASQYRFILGLLQQGGERWADVPEEDKGSTFRFTFARKVKVHLMETIIDSHFRAAGAGEENPTALMEAQGLAEELMDECAREKAPADPVSTFAFQIQPVVAAGKAFAYALRHRAMLKENRLDFAAGYWLHAPMMKACAKMYLTAGKLLPNDDPEKAVNLFNSLAFDLRGGGLTLSMLFERAAEAEAALQPPEKIFGPSSRLFDARQLVRHVCAAARAHLSPHLPSIPSSAFEATLKAVPTVLTDKIPAGKKWEDLVDADVWDRFLPGDLAVAELTSVPATTSASGGE